MKWIGYFCSVCLFCTSAVMASDLSSDESTKSKIELIECEVAYARYLIYKIQINHLSVYDGLPWVDGILDIVLDQLEEIKEGDLSQESPR